MRKHLYYRSTVKLKSKKLGSLSMLYKMPTLFNLIFLFSLCFVCCRGQVDEASLTAEKFKQYAVDAGVWDRVFMYDGHDFYTDIEWENITEEDYNRWKLYIDNCVMWLENEKKSLKEQEFARKLIDQAVKEAQGLSPEEEI